MSEELIVNLGVKVKAKRLERNLSREELAEKSGISDRHLFDIEKGRKELSISNFRRLAIALEVSADWLLACPPLPAKSVTERWNNEAVR